MPEPALESVPAELWRRLAAADGAWRTPVLASARPGGGANARTVVLRMADPAARELVFFTDCRSAKIGELRADGDCCFVVYDQDRGVQARLLGRARREQDAATLDGWWQRLGENQRRLYAADSGAGEKGRENFAAFRVTVERFHCLWLNERGNRAAEFAWDGTWRGKWVRP